MRVKKGKKALKSTLLIQENGNAIDKNVMR